MALAGFRHIGLKLVSIGLASLLWLLVAGEETVERALRIPLEFTNVPENLELMGDPPSVVDVRIRGSSGALGRVAAGELVAVLDLAAARQGQRLFHLTNGHVRAPFDVEVVQITPASVSIRFELSVAKIVPVVPVLEGEPADGFVVGAVKADPATVEIVGAASALTEVREAMTEPVSVAGARAAVTDTVAIGASDPSVRLRHPGSATVTVQVREDVGATNASPGRR